MIFQGGKFGKPEASKLPILEPHVRTINSQVMQMLLEEITDLNV